MQSLLVKPQAHYCLSDPASTRTDCCNVEGNLCLDTDCFVAKLTSPGASLFPHCRWNPQLTRAWVHKWFQVMDSASACRWNITLRQRFSRLHVGERQALRAWGETRWWYDIFCASVVDDSSTIHILRANACLNLRIWLHVKNCVLSRQSTALACASTLKGANEWLKYLFMPRWQGDFPQRRKPAMLNFVV
jgi:hypothetical protein